MKYTMIYCFLVFSAFHSYAQSPCIDSKEKALYALIMEYRASKDLAAIPWSKSLSKVADLHIEDLSAHYSFDGSNQCNPHSWFENEQWSSCCYTNNHKKAKCMWDKPRELTSYQGDGYEILFYHSANATPSAAMNGWKNSKSHDPLLVNANQWDQLKWNAIGIAVNQHWAAVWFGVQPVLEDPEWCKD